MEKSWGLLIIMEVHQVRVPEGTGEAGRESPRSLCSHASITLTGKGWLGDEGRQQDWKGLRSKRSDACAVSHSARQTHCPTELPSTGQTVQNASVSCSHAHFFGVEGFLFSLGEMAVSISSAPVSLVVRGKTCASNLQHAFSENPSEPRACSKGPVT